MRIKKYIVVLLFCASFNGYSQNWQSLNGGANGAFMGLFGDTINNILYGSGNFTSVGGVPVNYIAQWNGTNWDSLGSGSYNTTSGDGFAMFSGKMVCPNYKFSFSEQHIVSWNGTLWDSIGSNFYADGMNSFFGVSVLNNELYAYGDFDTINNISYNSIAKWDGSNWISIGFPYRTSFSAASVRSLAIYNGNIYAGGFFIDSLSQVVNIAKYNGSYWSVPGNSGFTDQVGDLEVYNNELYASGSFSSVAGDPGNKIARWNDTIWRDVGGGITDPSPATAFGFVSDLLLLNNKLYACGAFSGMGGISANRIASWDGTNWCGFGNADTGTVGYMATINDDLYIATSVTWDTITVNYIAKWIGGTFVDTCGHINTGINNLSIESEINLYPNPASNQINLEFELNEIKNVSIEIKNVLGQTIKIISNNNFIKGKNKIEIDVAEFSNGIYFIQLQSDNKIISQKFIKQ